MAESSDFIHVLLVDDEPDFLEITARRLTRRGFATMTAADGPAALSQLEDHVPDVVVLDYKMPGPDGEQVFQQIKRRWPDLPVIMLTGHSSVRQAFRTSKQGVYDYLAKPCDINELITTVRAAARDGGSAPGAPSVDSIQ